MLKSNYPALEISEKKELKRFLFFLIFRLITGRRCDIMIEQGQDLQHLLNRKSILYHSVIKHH